MAKVLLLTCFASLFLLVSAVEAEPPDNSVSLGIRTLLNDPTAAALGAKIKLTDIGRISVSLRPEVLFGKDIEGRFTVTGEVELRAALYPFAGIGIAVNTDQTHAIDPMMAGGLEVRLHPPLSVRLEGRMIFQTTIDDTDFEFITSLNSAF